MQFCSHCGHEARARDRFCIGCGAEINAAADAADAPSVFRAPEHPRRRAGGFVVRHARALMALGVVAVIVAIAALSDSSSDTTPGPEDAAPAAAVATEESRQEANSRDDGAESQPNTDSEQTVTAKGSDGKTYQCPSSGLAQIDAAADKVTRRKKVLKARRDAVRRIERQYPSGNAPAEVIERYDTLFARANAQVTWVNKAVGEYNALLRSECTSE
jgi:hypothetical protein